MEMAEKRGMTTRYGGERPGKRKEPTPPVERPTTGRLRSTSIKDKQTPVKMKPVEIPVEKLLPTKVAEAKPLPTVDNLQSSELSDREYHSIKRSAVLALSLQRSRHKWLTEGIFERYWTKPSKKRHQGAEMEKNPAKTTMSLLGRARLTIEPHVFEIILYGVREPTTATPVNHQFVEHKPIIQYGPPATTGAAQSPAYGSKGGYAPATEQTQRQTKNTGHEITPNSAPQQLNPNSQSRPSLAPASNPAPHSGYYQQPATPIAPGRPYAPPSQPPAQSPDPVIHMLAQRAGHDPELKAIMKIVAAGDANPQQLQFFQRHIDELTAVLHSRTGPAQKATPVQRPHVNNAPVSANPGASSHAGTPHAAGHFTPPVNGRQMHPYQIHSQAPMPLKAKSPLPAPRADYSSLVFEFVAGSADRFLFPKYSILEFLPGNRQVLASFLIVRKGDRREGGNYDPNREYFQPVTVRLSTDDPKVLAPLSRVVASPDEARKHMDEIMDRAARAEEVHLALRLPKRSENAEGDDEDKGAGSRERSPSTPPAPPVREKRKYTRRATIVAA